MLKAMLLLRHSVMQPGAGWHMFFASVTSPANTLLFLLGWLGFCCSRRRPEWALPRLYFLLAWTLPVIPIMQAGAAVNYLFEGWTASALLLPLALDCLQFHWRKISPLSQALTLALLLFYFWNYQLPPYRFLVVPAHNYGDLRPLRRMRVFSSDDYLAVHSRRPELLDPYLARVLELTGHFSSAPILARLDHKTYNELFLGDAGGALPAYRGIPYYSRAEIIAIRENYRLLCAAGGITVWLPRRRPPPLNRASASRLLNRSCQPQPFRLHRNGRY